MFRATEGQCTLDHWYSFLSLDPLYTLPFLSHLGKINSMEQPKNMDEVLRLWKIEDTGSEFSLYDFSQIADATDFSPNNILGEGGFGPGVMMCVQEKAVDRPTMSDVVAMLSSDDITLPEPRQPAYS